MKRIKEVTTKWVLNTKKDVDVDLLIATVLDRRNRHVYEESIEQSQDHDAREIHGQGDESEQTTEEMHVQRIEIVRNMEADRIIAADRTGWHR